MRGTVEILEGIPTEDLKALAERGLLRRNVVRELQAVAQYHNMITQDSLKITDACDRAASKYGMSARTMFRVIKIYAE